MNTLSILIPTLTSRKKSFDKIYSELQRQITEGDYQRSVKIEWERDNGEMTIGAKRNILLERADCDYVVFVDDDDWISGNYIKLVMDGIQTNPDCCSLKGIITWDGKRPELFEHTLKFDKYRTNEQAKSDEIKYERFPNHLNAIKSFLAKQFRFPESNHGEDTDFATQIFNSGLLKIEHYIPEVLYHYLFKPSK